MTGAHARPELLASPDWLAENLGRPEVRVLDVRWRPDGSGLVAFAEGHIPSATHLDWRQALSEPAPDEAGVLLAPPDRVAAALEQAGIGNGATVVVYDDTASLYAARTWWSLRAYGLESVRILDGGYPAWVDSGRPISHAVQDPPRATFTPRAALRVRLTTSDVRALAGSPDALILDARAQVEFRGLQGSGRALGHIPAAVSLPAGSLTVPGSQRFLDGGELRSILARCGVDRVRRVVCYDKTGVAAAKVAFVLALMGHDDVAVYDGGWPAWITRPEAPVEGEPIGAPLSGTRGTRGTHDSSSSRACLGSGECARPAGHAAPRQAGGSGSLGSSASITCTTGALSGSSASVSCAPGARSAHAAASRNGAKICARAWFTATIATVWGACPSRSDQKTASVTGTNFWRSSLRLSRNVRSGSRWMVPITRNGGMETKARSAILSVRSSRTGWTACSVTANRTDRRLTCAKLVETGGRPEPYSSSETSSRTRYGSSAVLRMSVTRWWRVWSVPRTTNCSV